MSIERAVNDATADDNRRFVIVHYHLFKNAGTSVDKALKTAVGDRWASIEAGHGDQRLSPSALRTFIDNRPEVLAVSSHTAMIKPQDLGEDLRVIPIVFLRHPLDRMRSAYDFERRQGADTLGSRMARTLNFPEYVRFFIRHGRSRSFRNFQTHRLAAAAPEKGDSELERALAALELLPHVGVVERYSHSIRQYEQLIRSYLPGFQLAPRHENVGGRHGLAPEARLKEIRTAMGPELHEEATQENLQDLQIWERSISLAHYCPVNS